jgi:caa(3)-type oxidase subunit IV
MSEHHINYKKIYFILLGLLVLSILGPEIGIKWVTIITAFGIALVKADLVVQNFMHLRSEKRIMKWMLATSLILMALFVAGVSPDVLRHEGTNWVNVAALDAVERGIDSGDHGEEAEHAAAEEHAEEAPAEGADGEVAAAVAPQEFNAQQAFNTACAVCHGTAGDGNGPAGAALMPKPANFTDAAFWAERDDARIFTSIKEGAMAVGGSPLMVGWSTSYNDEQIQAIVDYLKTAFRPE